METEEINSGSHVEMRKRLRMLIPLQIYLRSNPVDTKSCLLVGQDLCFILEYLEDERGSGRENCGESE